MRQLQREDIVGRRIGGVLRTPWRVKDGWATCRTFVALSGGAAFELEGRAVFETSPIYEVDVAPLHLIPAFAEDSG